MLLALKCTKCTHYGPSWPHLSVAVIAVLHQGQVVKQLSLPAFLLFVDDSTIIVIKAYKSIRKVISVDVFRVFFPSSFHHSKHILNIIGALKHKRSMSAQQLAAGDTCRAAHRCGTSTALQHGKGKVTPWQTKCFQVVKQRKQGGPQKPKAKTDMCFTSRKGI